MEIEHATPNRNLRTLKNGFEWLAPFTVFECLIKSLINLMKNIPVMNNVWRERQELARMTTTHLLDAGLDPIQVQQECRRSYFDIPTDRKMPTSTL